jgi:hypothetical protein
MTSLPSDALASTISRIVVTMHATTTTASIILSQDPKKRCGRWRVRCENRAGKSRRRGQGVVSSSLQCSAAAAAAAAPYRGRKSDDTDDNLEENNEVEDDVDSNVGRANVPEFGQEGAQAGGGKRGVGVSEAKHGDVVSAGPGRRAGAPGRSAARFVTVSCVLGKVCVKHTRTHFVTSVQASMPMQAKMIKT